MTGKQSGFSRINFHYHIVKSGENFTQLRHWQYSLQAFTGKINNMQAIMPVISRLSNKCYIPFKKRSDKPPYSTWHILCK
jgi:hypothetical protein